MNRNARITLQMQPTVYWLTFPSAATLFGFAPIIFICVVFFTFFVGFAYAFFRKCAARPFLDKSIQQIQLADKVQLNHNTIRLRFSLPSPDYCLGLPVGKHIKIYAPNCDGSVPGQWNGKPVQQGGGTLTSASNATVAGHGEVERKYTPVTGDKCLGYVDFVIKVYYKKERPEFPDGGKVSQYLDSLRIGDVINILGPVGLLTYHGMGVFSYGTKQYPPKKRIGMIAGGTGITPMLQVIKHILSRRDDHTEIFLLYANQTEDDILLRDCLEEYATLYPQQFRLWYTIDRPLRPDEWHYSIGYIDMEMLQKHFLPYDTNTVALLCGPPPMVKNACIPNLRCLGWPESDMLRF